MNTLKDLVLSMQNVLLADAIRGALREGAEFRVHVTEKAEEIVETCRLLQPAVLLLETTGYPPCTFEERMKLRKLVRRDAPGCKIVLLCDEQAEKDVAFRVKLARQEGQIDAFFYASVSASYLVAALDAL